MGLSADIREFISEHPGMQFTNKTIYDEFSLRDDTHRARVRQLLREMFKAEQLVKKNGKYRLVDTDAPDINWQKSSGEDYALLLPFDLHNWISLKRKSVLVVAGEIGAGKTAFLYGVAILNMHTHKVHLWSTAEGGGDEMRERMVGIKPDIPDPAPFRTRERYEDFEDVVALYPDDLHIIDYLDEGEEAWKVRFRIKHIVEALHGGVAIIGLQKPAGRDTPYGKEHAYRHAHAAVAMSVQGTAGALKITKARGRPNKNVNPINKQWTYMFNGGGNFTNIQEGRYE